jgi:hypothetical protein
MHFRTFYAFKDGKEAAAAKKTVVYPSVYAVQIVQNAIMGHPHKARPGIGRSAFGGSKRVLINTRNDTPESAAEENQKEKTDDSF